MSSAHDTQVHIILVVLAASYGVLVMCFYSSDLRAEICLACSVLGRFSGLLMVDNSVES